MKGLIIGSLAAVLLAGCGAKTSIFYRPCKASAPAAECVKEEGRTICHQRWAVETPGLAELIVKEPKGGPEYTVKVDHTGGESFLSGLGQAVTGAVAVVMPLAIADKLSK